MWGPGSALFCQNIFCLFMTNLLYWYNYFVGWGGRLLIKWAFSPVRQNDADPTGSGSATRLLSFFCYFPRRDILTRGSALSFRVWRTLRLLRMFGTPWWTKWNSWDDPRTCTRHYCKCNYKHFFNTKPLKAREGADLGHKRFKLYVPYAIKIESVSHNELSNFWQKTFILDKNYKNTVPLTVS